MRGLAGARPEFTLPAMLPFPHSLCHRCAHLRVITSGRGSVFLMCTAPDARAIPQKYPAQPVLRCGWFLPRPPPPEGAL